MSTENVNAFFARLQGDTALRDQVVALGDATAEERLDGLLRLAREHGFDVTREDLALAAEAAPVAALDDETLDAVAGGSGALGCDGPCDSSVDAGAAGIGPGAPGF